MASLDFETQGGTMNHRTFHSLGLAILTTLVAGALIGTASAQARVVSLRSMTLTTPDLPAGFSQKFSHRLPARDAAALQGAGTNGLVDGWQRLFTRLQGVDTAAVTSSVLRYASAGDADQAVRSSWRHILTYTSAKRVSVDRPLGDAARAITYQTTGGVTALTVIWRSGNIDSSVLVIGLKSIGTTLDLARQLAVKQQQHIAMQ
jgi:hypothetical protein